MVRAKDILCAALHISIVILAFSVSIIIGFSAINDRFSMLAAFLVIAIIIMLTEKITLQIEKKWNN